MDNNILIQSQKNALKLLLMGNCVSQTIPNNEPKIYEIEDVLYPFKKSNHTLIVWAIKTSKCTYAGILIKSGMRKHGLARFVNAVRVSFNELDIIEEKSPGDFIHSYLRLNKSNNGTLVLTPTVVISFVEQARLFLSRLYPYLPTEGKEVSLISYGAAQREAMSHLYWGIKTNSVFRAVNVETAKPRIISCSKARVLSQGERINENYIVIARKKGLKIYFQNIKKAGI